MLAITLTNFKEASDILTALSSDELADEISEQAALIFKSDIVDWIKGGHSFTSRTGNLLASMQADISNNNVADIMAGGDKALYAQYVEFGSNRSKPYPFFYADMDNRKAHILEKSTDIIRAKIHES